MSKKFLTRLLAVVMSAGLVLQPVAVCATEPGVGEEVKEAALEETEVVEQEENNEFDVTTAEVVEGTKTSIAGEIVDVVEVSAVQEEAGPMDDEPITLPKRIIDSDFCSSEIEEMVKYGKSGERPDFETPKGALTAVRFVNWEYYNDGQYEKYTDYYFGHGLYRAVVEVTIDPFWIGSYKFGTTFNYSVDGYECDLIDKTTDETGEITSYIFGTRPISTEGQSLPILTNVYVDGGYLYWDLLEEASWYKIDIGGHSFGYENPPANIQQHFEYVYDVGDIKYGTHPVIITARNNVGELLSESYTIYYDFREPRPIFEKEVISSVNLKSDIDEILVVGQDIRTPTYTLVDAESPVKVDPLYWYHGGKGDYTGFTFERGTYNTNLFLYLSGDDRNLYEFDENLTLFVDGQEWEMVSYSEFGEKSGFYFQSPDFLVGEVVVPEPEPEEPEDPEEPEKHSGTWKNKYGSTYYETEDGEALTGMQSIDGDTYFFNKKGILQCNVFHEEDGKTFYFGKDGKMVTGFMDKWGASYYFNEAGEMQTGFVDIDGDTYYFKADGRMVKSTWITVGSDKFYTKADGKVAKSETILKWGKKYTFDDRGALVP